MVRMVTVVTGAASVAPSTPNSSVPAVVTSITVSGGRRRALPKATGVEPMSYGPSHRGQRERVGLTDAPITDPEAWQPSDPAASSARDERLRAVGTDRRRAVRHSPTPDDAGSVALGDGGRRKAAGNASRQRPTRRRSER